MKGRPSVAKAKQEQEEEEEEEAAKACSTSATLKATWKPGKSTESGSTNPASCNEREMSVFSLIIV